MIDLDQLRIILGAEVRNAITSVQCTPEPNWTLLVRKCGKWVPPLVSATTTYLPGTVLDTRKVMLNKIIISGLKGA